jgi:triacylglycerol esterase/lipase EstA (alpha/beta hydrolase family)
MEVRRRGIELALAGIVTVALLALAGPASALSGPYAPLDRPGPRLSVPADKLRAALSCTPGIAGDTRNPILLVPGTDLDPGPNYSWNYERAFAALHWAYCSVTLPDHTTGDIQTAGEYVVYALRTMTKLSGRQVDVLGYSQGGMLPRWALRFWPDTRPLVHAFVSLDPSNHGTLDADASCQSQCSPADWQQASTAHFMGALNSFAETFAGIDYTVIFSRTDEIVVPNFDSSGSSSLHTGGGTIANIAVQQICPNDTSEHLAMGSYDAVGYALAVDAFTHESVADPSRVPISVCAQTFQPGVDPSSFASNYGNYLDAIGQAQESAPQVSAEPPLQCYVFAGCPTPAAPKPGGRTHHPKHKRHHNKKRHQKHRHRHNH